MKTTGPIQFSFQHIKIAFKIHPLIYNFSISS